METTFKFITVDFKQILSDAGKLSKASKDINIRISIQPKVAEFHFIGMIRYMEIEEENLCDVLVPFRILKAIAKTQSTSKTTLKIRDGQIEFNGILISDSAIIIQSLISAPEMELTMNAPKLHLLQLRKKHSHVELQRLGLVLEISKVEQSLERSLLEAAKNLGQYGLTYSVLRKVADQIIDDSFVKG